MWGMLQPGTVQPRPVVLWSLRLAPVVLVLGTVVLWWVSEGAYWLVVGEDRIAEWLTFCVYVAVAFASGAAALQLNRSGLRLEAGLFALLALGAFVIAGEEVSWFQRQLGFAGPPELVERNLQGEANLHNVLERPLLHGSYIAVGLYGSVIAHHVVPRIPRLRDRPWLFVPPRVLSAWFGVAVVYYVWADYLNPVLRAVWGQAVDIETLTGIKLQEVVELALAGGFLLFLVSLLRSGELTQRPLSTWPLDVYPGDPGARTRPTSSGHSGASAPYDDRHDPH